MNSFVALRELLAYAGATAPQRPQCIMVILELDSAEFPTLRENYLRILP